MAKFYFVVAIVLMVLAVFCQTAQVRPRSRLTRLNQSRPRYLARQTIDEEAITPYPSADELKPEVPFEEAEIPAVNAPEPDLVYGPPDANTYNVPDEVYGPPEITDNVAAPTEAAAEAFGGNTDQAQLAAIRRADLRRRQLAKLRAQRTAKLRASPQRSA